MESVVALYVFFGTFLSTLLTSWFGLVLVYYFRVTKPAMAHKKMLKEEKRRMKAREAQEKEAQAEAKAKELELKRQQEEAALEILERQRELLEQQAQLQEHEEEHQSQRPLPPPMVFLGASQHPPPEAAFSIPAISPTFGNSRSPSAPPLAMKPAVNTPGRPDVLSVSTPSLELLDSVPTERGTIGAGGSKWNSNTFGGLQAVKQEMDRLDISDEAPSQAVPESQRPAYQREPSAGSLQPPNSDRQAFCSCGSPGWLVSPV